MSNAFGAPGVDFHHSGEDRHVELSSDEKRTPPAGGSNTDRRPWRPWSWLLPWLNTTDWWTKPRPPIAVLLQEARTGEWTVKQWHRTCRVCWLQTFARAGRLLPHVAARYVVEEPPRLWGELPAVRDIADDTEISRWPRIGYVLANGASWVTDGAIRTTWAAAGLEVFLICLNAEADWAVPDVLTVTYWWPDFLHLLRLLLPILIGLAVIAVAAVVGAWRRKRKWRQRRDEATRQLDMDNDEEGEGR